MQVVFKKIGIAIAFFFLYQQMWSPFIFNGTINDVAVFISKILSVVYLLAWFNNFLANRTSYKPVLYVAIIFLSLFISTVLMDGDIRRWFSMAYCPLGLAAFFCVNTIEKHKLKIMLSGIAGLFWIVCLLNFIFVILFPEGLKGLRGQNEMGMYLLGGENQVGFPLLVGLAFMLLSSVINKSPKFFVLSYFCLQITALLIIFSGGNITGTFMAYFMLMPIIRKKVGKFSLNYILLTIFGLFFIFIVFNQLSILLHNETVIYIITEVFDKSLDLSGRTEIWDIVLKKFFDSPILGHGIQDSVNLFIINHIKFSAHNQYLQSLYEGGVLMYISFIPLIGYASNSLKRCNDNYILLSTIVGIIVMGMSEAAGLTGLIVLLLLACTINRHYSKENRLVKK